MASYLRVVIAGSHYAALAVIPQPLRRGATEFAAHLPNCGYGRVCGHCVCKRHPFDSIRRYLPNLHVDAVIQAVPILCWKPLSKLVEKF
jgi:hypothetical protein